MTGKKDTQLPRYQVFLQEREGAPYQDVGSVHASDVELALQNARDVFARRPGCHSLWVIPAAAIFSQTRQELERWHSSPGKDPGEQETYYVSYKQKTGGTQTVIGTVEAPTPEVAMERALEQFSVSQPPFAWWVFPARSVTASTPDEIPSMFDPALEKPFRLSAEFKTVSAMRELKQVGPGDQ